MKRLLSLLLALLALCDLARGQAVNTLSVSNNVADTNYMLFVVGNRLVRVSKTNVFDAIKPTDATFTGTVSAASFIGSGTGVPILKLQTMMAADNAFAISVRTNFTQSTTNFFEVTNASAGQAMVLHSAAAGQLVWTNATASGGGGVTNNGLTNATFIGLVDGTSAIKTVTAGAGVTMTDRGTNILVTASASAYTLGGALVATAVPSSAGILVASCFTLHPTVSGLQQNASGAATAPLGRLYFHQNVVISHINLHGSSQIQTTTNLALMLMTNGIAATNMTAVLVGNDSRFVATNTTATVTLLAGSYLTMLMTNNAAIPSANWVWSFKVTPQ